MGGARGRAYAIDGGICGCSGGVGGGCGGVIGGGVSGCGWGGDEDDGDGVHGSRVVMMMYAGGFGGVLTAIVVVAEEMAAARGGEWIIDLNLCYDTFKFKEGESLTQTFTRYKALMNELVKDGIKLLKLEINTGFINGLPKKWLSFCQSLRNINNVKDYELASLFDKLKYEENLIDNFQDSLDDEEDTRSSHEYLNDLDEEYQARALLAKFKRFFKKAKYNKVKAKLALLSLSSSASMVKNKENDAVSKEGAINGEWVKISMRKVHTFLEMEDNDDRKVFLDYLCIDLNYVEEQKNESLVCSIPLHLLKKLDDAKPISRQKTIKSILRSKSIFKAKALKDVTINEPSQLLLWYLQNEHHALWEVIEFGDSYKALQAEAASESSTKKKGRTVVSTIKDMQKRRNDVKARTTLLLAQPDEHQLRFSSKTLEQTFNRLQAIVSHLEFMDVEIKQYDLNQKFLTSLAPEWLMYIIVWRNRDDLDTVSLDDVYNHLKVYEPEVQKKSESNSQNMTFISSANTSSGKGEVHTASVLIASTQVASVDVAAASISHDNVCAHIAFQSNGSQIKYKDITQIDEDDIEEMDTKECIAPRSQDKGRRESYKQGSKEEELAPKALMAINEIGWDWSYIANEEENHALVANNEAPIEFVLMDKSSSSSKNKEVRELIRTRRVLDTMLFSPHAQVYSPPKKDMSSTGLPEFADDTITDYSRPSTSIESNTSDLQNSNSSIFEHGESSSSIMSKPMIKFVKAADSPTVIKTNKFETARKSFVKYAEMYRNTSKSPKARGNQCNLNNLKSQQLGKDFLIKNKACFKCGHFDHLAYDCGVWVEKRKIWPKNNFAHKKVTPRAVLLKTGRTPIAVNRTNMNANSHNNIDDKEYWDSGCSRHMTGNISYLSDGNFNPTATSKIPPADQMETLTVKSEIPTVSSPVPTACLDNSPETLSASRLISKGVISQEETPSLDNILTLSNRFEDILGDTINTVDTNGVEVDLSDMESIIPASPTPTFRIHKDHPKSQIIGPVDTTIHTRHKSKEMEEHSFIATIYQKTNPDLLQFCLFLCFLSQEEPKKIFDALKDPRWPFGFQDPEFSDRVYKVEKAMDTIDQTLFIKKHRGDFLLVQVSANTPMDKENPEGKDGPGKDVELHMYRSMIESLMYLTASRQDTMFAIYACARHQVTPKECHLHSIKRIFRYLKGHPKLRLWYPKESSFDLVAYSDSDYGGATQDRKSTTGECQFLGRRLISWQCKK
nr:hypothetical protein [Tanacetum cinerariifolium]